jgi:hypothetical protein
MSPLHRSINKMGTSMTSYCTAKAPRMLVRKRIKTLKKSWCQNLLSQHKKSNKWFQVFFFKAVSTLTLLYHPKAFKSLSQIFLHNRSIEREGRMSPWISWEQSEVEAENLKAPTLHTNLLKVTWSSAVASSASLKLLFMKDIPCS